MFAFGWGAAWGINKGKMMWGATLRLVCAAKIHQTDDQGKP